MAADTRTGAGLRPHANKGGGNDDPMGTQRIAAANANQQSPTQVAFASESIVMEISTGRDATCVKGKREIM